MKVGEIWQLREDRDKSIIGIPICDKVKILTIRYEDWYHDYRIEYVFVGEEAFEGSKCWLGREKFLTSFKRL